MGSLEKLKSVASDKILLYIEGDKVLQKNFGIYLQKTFKNFYQAYDGKEGFDLFLKEKPDLVIMDLDLLKKDSIELIIDMKEYDKNIKIVTVSSSNENYTLLQSIDMELSGMLLKPINFAQLVNKLISFLPPAKKTVAPKIEKLKTLQTINVSKKEDIIKKEKKIISEPNLLKVERKPIVVEQVEQKVKKEAEKKIEPNLKVESKLKIKTPKICIEDIEEFTKNQEELLLINHYKGIMIHNQGKFVSYHKNSFEIEASTAQIIAANYEKHIVLKVVNKNKYIFANIINIDLKANKLQLARPYYINYQDRDKNTLRLSVDKSFKVTMFFNNTHIEFKVKQISLKYIVLITNNRELSIKRNMQLDLTLGFEIDSPSTLIKEKKFTKTFAKGIVKRVNKTDTQLQIAMNLEVQKSGQSSLKKYLKQRESETIEELKKVMKKRSV